MDDLLGKRQKITVCHECVRTTSCHARTKADCYAPPRNHVMKKVYRH